MVKKMVNLYHKIAKKIARRVFFYSDSHLFCQGQILSRLNRNIDKLNNVSQAEFKIFSQWGDDGIIDWLVEHLNIEHKLFVEFGVENYTESNTRFLMMHKNWSGLIFDGSQRHIDDVKNSYYYWMYDLTAKKAFIDKNNINQLISEWSSVQDIGLLHIDIDGNDYWIWKEINCIQPIIVIVEYNALFGNERAITIPYQADFYRTQAHHSNLYYGASLKALDVLANQKGYTFIGCNTAGNNAYFIRNDKLNDCLPKVSVENGFMPSKFRECRNQRGHLMFPSHLEALAVIKGMPVYNVLTNQLEEF